MILLAVLLLLSIEPKPDCEMVRAQVQQHGKIKAMVWALANGLSPKEISRIRKQCGV